MRHGSSFATATRVLLAVALLAALAACGSDNGSMGPNTGSINVVVTTSGSDLDSAGYAVSVDHQGAQAIGLTDSLTVSGVSAGSHTVALGAVGSNCTVTPSASQDVAVTEGATARAAFQIACALRQIVFASFPADSGDIFTIASDGTGAAALAASAGFDGLPDWSPNGELVVFSSSREHTGHGFDIWVVHPDGSGLQRITTAAGENGLAVWSPDGASLAFVSTRSDTSAGHAEIWVMNAAGTNQTQLTHDGALANNPTWSGDGQQIAYSSTVSGMTQIWAMHADGSNPQRLTDDAFTDAAPAWSPDGAQIAFQSDRDRTGADAAQVEVYVMNADGSNPVRLTNSPGFDGAPSWSSDGKQIVFESSRTGHSDVFVMQPDGSAQRRVTNNGADNGTPRFKP